MEAKGIIFTALDTDHDNIETWNRWYDLEHLPPNLAMPEIAVGRRYVAPPELHDTRLPPTPHADAFESDGSDRAGFHDPRSDLDSPIGHALLIALPNLIQPGAEMIGDHAHRRAPGGRLNTRHLHDATLVGGLPEAEDLE